MNQIEEKLYEIAGEELATKQVNRGVWTKAFATAQGHEAKTKAAYIELRVAQLREQLQEELEGRLQEQLHNQVQEHVREQLQKKQQEHQEIAARKMERLTREENKRMEAEEKKPKVCKSCQHYAGGGYRGFCDQHQKKVSCTYVCTDFVRRAL